MLGREGKKFTGESRKVSTGCPLVLTSPEKGGACSKLLAPKRYYGVSPWVECRMEPLVLKRNS